MKNKVTGKVAESIPLQEWELDKITLGDLRRGLAQTEYVDSKSIRIWKTGTLLTDDSKTLDTWFTHSDNKADYSTYTMWDIIDRQNVDGSWSNSILDILWSTDKKLKDSAPDMVKTKLNGDDQLTALYTLLALEGLKQCFDDKAAEWKLVAMKGKMFLQKKGIPGTIESDLDWKAFR